MTISRFPATEYIGFKEQEQYQLGGGGSVNLTQLC